MENDPESPPLNAACQCGKKIRSLPESRIEADAARDPGPPGEPVSKHSALHQQSDNTDDPKLEMLFESVERFEQLALTSLTALVDFFPILQSLPDFLMPMKAFATKVYEDTTELYVGHWLEVKDSIRSGTSKPCLSVDLAKLQEEEGFSDEQAAYISGEYTSSRRRELVDPILT
jgi:hypothetical protein